MSTKARYLYNTSMEVFDTICIVNTANRAAIPFSVMYSGKHWSTMEVGWFLEYLANGTVVARENVLVLAELFDIRFTDLTNH